MTRAQLLRSVPATAGVVAAAAVVFGAAEPALAALPTPDDYAFGTGSKVCMPVSLTSIKLYCKRTADAEGVSIELNE